MALTIPYSIPDLAVLDSSPIRLIVPLLGERYFCVVGADKTLQVSNTAGIRARLAIAGEAHPLPLSDTYAWVRITTQNVGESTLTLKQGTTTLDVKVNVFPWRWVGMNFYLTTDPNGTPTFNASMAPKQVKVLDHVFRGQACIDFYKHIVLSRTVATDCSLSMTTAQENAMWDEFKKKTPGDLRCKMFFNVFCVKAWGGHDRPGYDAWATSHGNYIIADDGALSDSTPVIAHEMGHSLGLSHSNTDGYLMRQGANKGPKLTWADVQTVRGYVD